MFQLILEGLLPVILSFCVGLYVYKSMNTMQRILFFQAFSYMLIYIVSFIVTALQSHYKTPLNNQWVYNLSMPIETFFLTWAASAHFTEHRQKILIWIGFILFFSIYIVQIIIKGINVFSTQGYIAESILMLIIYLFILYSCFIEEYSNWKYSPGVWICFGIILYFGGSIPYLSLLSYLENNASKTGSFLYHFIVEGLANLRYIMLAIGFWLIRRNALLKSAIANE